MQLNGVIKSDAVSVFSSSFYTEHPVFNLKGRVTFWVALIISFFRLKDAMYVDEIPLSCINIMAVSGYNACVKSLQISLIKAKLFDLFRW